MSNARYTVETLRKAGLQARWTKNPKGAPIIVARNPQAATAHQREVWWYVTRSVWEDMLSVGFVEGFDRQTLLGDIFSV